MIRVVAVDDELPALKMAESVLRSCEEVQICGLFDDPEELLERLPELEVDLALVDMKMPGMHGLELAGRIAERNPQIAVVFVTAYDDYAVEAFEADALDYVLKPMTAQRVRKTLDRYARMRGGNRQARGDNGLRVRSFGRFAVETGQGLKLKFRRAKTEELLAYLLHRQGQPVAKEQIMDALWGDRDAERAQAMLYTTLYQLRKELEAFGLPGAIEQTRSGGGLCQLRPVPDKWDCAEFERLCLRVRESGELAEAHQAAELYRGGYLAEHAYDWAAQRRAELELKYAELLERMSDGEVRRRRFEQALLHLHRLAAIQPYAVRVHGKIIAVHLLMNNEPAAREYERQTQSLFSGELGMMPELDIETLASDPLSLFQ